MYIQEVSTEFNISKKALNLYEEKGLLKPKKDKMGYRDYSQNDIQKLLMIKQLRNLDFSIQEIKDILNHNQYEIFDKKIQEYQKKYYELDTSLQYINDVKDIIINQQDIKNLSYEMDKTYDLKNIELEDNITYPFDTCIFALLTFAISVLSFKRPDDILSLLVVVIVFIAAALSSAIVQTYIYKIVKKFKK